MTVHGTDSLEALNSILIKQEEVSRDLTTCLTSIEPALKQQHDYALLLKDNVKRLESELVPSVSRIELKREMFVKSLKDFEDLTRKQTATKASAPRSCNDIKSNGNSASGFHMVQKNDGIQVVYCDFLLVPREQLDHFNPSRLLCTSVLS